MACQRIVINWGADDMSNLKSYFLLLLGLATCVASAAIAMIPTGVPGSGPYLVISSPWNGGPAAVVRTAGGQLVGPQTAPLAVLATDTSVEALKLAGAWMVTSPADLPFLCDAETVL